MTAYLFGYGSMMNRGSAGRALKRTLAPAELVPAYLHGYERNWSLKERVFSETLGREVTAVFLDLERAPGTRCNGVLVEISPEALDDLRRREKNYDPADVTDVVEGPPGLGPSREGDRVYTFVAKPEFRAAEGEPGLFVMERYVRMIDDACAHLGPGFAREYAASTRPIVHPRLDGRYVFVDQEQAKHV